MFGDAPVVQPAAPNKFLVIPFQTLNAGADQQWIGKAVQETLVANLWQSKNYSPESFQGQTIVEDNVAAARIARDASVPVAVRGSAQLVYGEIRLTAHLIYAKNGDNVTTSIVSGPLNNLLIMEDQLSVQLRRRTSAPGAQNATLQPPVAPGPASPACSSLFGPAGVRSAADDQLPAGLFVRRHGSGIHGSGLQLRSGLLPSDIRLWLFRAGGVGLLLQFQPAVFPVIVPAVVSSRGRIPLRWRHSRRRRIRRRRRHALWRRRIFRRPRRRAPLSRKTFTARSTGFGLRQRV